MAELWRRACESGYCVEVRSADEVGEVWELRDGKLGDASPVLEVTIAELDSFCAFWVSHRLSYREEPAVRPEPAVDEKVIWDTAQHAALDAWNRVSADATGMLYAGRASQSGDMAGAS